MNRHEMGIQTEALNYSVHAGKGQQMSFVDLNQELHSQNQMVKHHQQTSQAMFDNSRSSGVRDHRPDRKRPTMGQDYYNTWTQFDRYDQIR